MEPPKSFADIVPIVTGVNLVMSYIDENTRYPMIRNVPRKYNALTFVKEGTEHYKGENIDIVTSPGKILYIPKGTNYNIYSDSEYTDNICIDFDTAEPLNIAPFLYKPANPEKFKKLFSEFEAYFKLHSGSFPLGVIHGFYGILCELTEAMRASYQPSWQLKRVLAAEQYIEQHFTDPDIQASEIAKKANLSTRYFTEIFKEHFSVTPMKYVTEKRIKLAKQLLDAGFHSVTEIAHICGYNDIYCFSKAFKKLTGVSPTEYSRTSSV